VIAIDGTKVHANASEGANCDYERLARQILAEADSIDEQEDARFGERRGDELPEHLATGDGCAKYLAQHRQLLLATNQRGAITRSCRQHDTQR
jgi:hypothetical protein